MTVNWRCSLWVFVLFMGSGSPEPVCSLPYSCLPTSDCAERHSARGTDEVLFTCEGGEKVCCPPIKSFPSISSDIYTTTTESGCAQCATQQNRPQGVHPTSEPSGNRGTTGRVPEVSKEDPGMVGHHVHEYQPSVTRPQHSESRRPPPVQPSEGRRPPISQQTPQSQRPQNSQNQPQPQRPQNSQNQPQPQRPQNSQTSSPSQKPQSSQNQPKPQNPQPSPQPTPLSSHRNFGLLPSESNCGVNNFANRITEGEEVSLGEYPWMVLTGIKDKYGNYRWNCGGTLINERYVLTAAHCLVVDNRTIEFVRLGEHNLLNQTDCYREICLEPPEDVAIAEVIPHEKWNTTTIKNDIALIRLSRNPLQLGKSNIYPICLPVDMEKVNISSSTKYEIAGWGKTDWNADEGSDVLRKASISGVSREECNICKDKKKQQYCPIIDTQLCVQGWKSVDVCKGDSGGPLMVTRLNIYQIGITSFKGSEYCGAENIPSIFTKVESYLPWILDNIRK